MSAVADWMSTTQFYTWHDLTGNLECRSEMCCMRLAGNAGPKKSLKIVICAPLHNFVGLYLRKAHIDNWKKMLNSNISPHVLTIW